jgi:hypothetical protein
MESKPRRKSKRLELEMLKKRESDVAEEELVSLGRN